MFTLPAPATPSVSTTPLSPASPSPRPQNRLRGLSYLRNYSHHLHLHGSSSAGGSSTSRADPRSPRTAASQDSHTTHHPSSTTARSNTPNAATPPASPSVASPTSLSHIDPAQRSPSSTQPATDTDAAQRSPLPDDPSPASTTMTRNRSETAVPGLTVRNQSGPTPAASPPPTMDDRDANAEGAGANKLNMPSIRFIPHQDPRAGRPSLQFPTITRTLQDESSIIRVGRYSERDNLPDVPANVPSAAAVGFKSKVVSRKHCELWCSNSQWYIKDVKSSSGTFLNHIRLSQPNVESKPFKVKDGDIIQLGIDFRGGEEMIFRCVKIRIECNRGWQQGLNNFNKQTHQRLRALAKTKKDSDSASTTTSECSICLMGVAPCQSLFVAPCSHVWHYKCIRPILNGPTWPNFLCPNCRAVADLEADVEDLGDFEEWDEDVAAEASAENGETSKEDRQITPRASHVPLINAPEANGVHNSNGLPDLEAAVSSINIADSPSAAAQGSPANVTTPPRATAPAASSSVTQPLSINASQVNENLGVSPLFRQDSTGLSPERAPDCPMTPRNDAGPFVLDGSGSAGRASGTRSRDEPNPEFANASTTAPVLPPLQID